MAKEEVLAAQLKSRAMLDEDKAQYNDCLSCRVVGATAFVAAGTFTYVSGTMSLHANKSAILKSGSMFGIKSRQTALAGMSLMLVGAGIYRLLN